MFNENFRKILTHNPSVDDARRPAATTARCKRCRQVDRIDRIFLVF